MTIEAEKAEAGEEKAEAGEEEGEQQSASETMLKAGIGEQVDITFG